MLLEFSKPYERSSRLIGTPSPRPDHNRPLPRNRDQAASQVKPGLADVVGLQHSAGNRAVSWLLSNPGPPVQRFDTPEHLRLGDNGTPAAQAEQVLLASDFSLTYGEMIAMSGDYFGSLAEMETLARIHGPGAGTREELEYVRTVKVRKGEDTFSQDAKDAADRRYVTLALDNRSHFVDPRNQGAAGTAPDAGEAVHEELRVQWNGILPSFENELVVPRAGAGYRFYHLEALFLAYVAGFDGHAMDPALAPESFGAHYLTDSFSGGHLRTNRQSIGDYWNPKVPMFLYNLKAFIAQALAARIAAGTWTSTDLVFHGVSFLKAGAMEEVSAALDEKAPLRFGDVVSGAIHDYDSERGVEAVADGRPVHLMGDDKLGGRTEELAREAVNFSHNDVTRAWFLGRQKASMDSVLPAVTQGKMFGAERLIPRAVADSELPADQRSVKWDFATVEELLADPVFQKALVIFGQRKAGELSSMTNGLPEVARPHFGPAVVEPFRTAALETLTRVINHTPDTGGGLFGHNQDDNALDYYEQAKSTGAVATLTVEQRVRLCRDLLDGYTASDEEDAVFDLLTAQPAHSRVVISAVGWARLEDEIGRKFSAKFPESSYR